MWVVTVTIPEARGTGEAYGTQHLVDVVQSPKVPAPGSLAPAFHLSRPSSGQGKAKRGATEQLAVPFLLPPHQAGTQHHVFGQILAGILRKSSENLSTVSGKFSLENKLQHQS